MPTAREIAVSIDAFVQGPDLEVEGARSLGAAERGTIVFLARHNGQSLEMLNSIKQVVCITTPDLAKCLDCTCLVHDQPRLAFCLTLAYYFTTIAENTISIASVVSPQAKIGVGVGIGAVSVIGPAVKVGADTQIGSGVAITGRVEIGAECIMRSNTTIGEPGFGFAFREDGEPIAFPHIGGVRIGNAVEIGSNCTVARSALDDTVIGNYVKMDNHIHVAHNVRIGPRTLIAAGAIISGSVTIGADVWIGPSATIIDHVTVGNHAHIGIGSVVTRSVESGVKVLGNPARKIPSSR